MEISEESKQAFSVFQFKEFRAYQISRFLITIALQMQSVIVGWLIYQQTKDALSLGLIGLTEAVPAIGVALYAGHIADKYSRKKIIVASVGVLTIAYAGMVFITANLSGMSHFGIVLIYCVIFTTGFCRGFIQPAMVAFMPQLIPREHYPRAVIWNSSTFQVAAVVGPAMGGLIYGYTNVTTAYIVVVSLLVLSFFILLTQIKHKPIPQQIEGEPISKRIIAGIHFVRENQALLGAITLDLFAVLFGGVTAVLPIFADKILHCGPVGLGWLRAAPSIGSVLIALYMAYHPPLRKAGMKLFGVVTGFGLCMIAFAFSHNFVLSFAILFLSGCFDNVSVIIRSSIIQLLVPDNMRGRVSSVNSIFIGSSNEIGAFESGTAAKLMGLIPSVIFGGTMTLLVVAGSFRFMPALKKLSL
jgi:MFS family permease